MSTVHAPHSDAIASQLGAGQSELVAQRRRQRLVLQHVDAALLAVDVERDQPLDRAGQRRFVLPEDRRAKQYADAETVAPAAITPLMKVRREWPPSIPWSIMSSPRNCREY